jgi:hypothetical protein
LRLISAFQANIFVTVALLQLHGLSSNEIFYSKSLAELANTNSRILPRNFLFSAALNTF